MSYPIQRYRRHSLYLYGDPPAVPLESVNPDTYHERQDWLSRGVSNVVTFWTDISKNAVGSAFQGLGKGLADSFGVSESTMWLIAAGLAVYLITQKKGRR